MVTGSKGNNNMMLVKEWLVDFMVDAKTEDVKTEKKNSGKKNSGNKNSGKKNTAKKKNAKKNTTKKRFIMSVKLSCLIK